MNTQAILLVGTGGALGAILRYGLSFISNDAFPAGTLIANLLGCTIIGILSYSAINLNESYKLLFAVGFCGALTTFSTFSKENLEFLVQEQWWKFFLYCFGSIALGLLFVLAGNRVAKFWLAS